MSGRMAARWHELAPLLDDLLDLTADARAAFLQDVADTELRTLLHELLAREAPSGFLDGRSTAYAESLIGAPAATTALQIGGYRVLELIGEGGSGSVYRAEREVDGYTQRVALKMLRVGLRDPLEQARFRRERRILARLEHPAIARLIDGGFSADGVPWFALEYIQGDTITRWCDARQLDISARLQLFLVVCDAVEAAHRALIVHRDIKPANILVDAQGRPHLLDFGIAKLLDDSEREDDTRTGLRRMTPAYAAPEQFSGASITTATDTYALGVLLHELLCGLRPLANSGDVLRLPSQRLLTDDNGRRSDDASRHALAAARSSSLRTVAQTLRGDLDTIVATALAAEPGQRYASVAALAADIQAYLQHRPIAARAAGLGYKTLKLLQRHRVAALASLLVVATATVGVIATLNASQRANRAAAEALQQAQRAAAVKEFVLALFAGVTPDESKGRAVGARELIERGESRLSETLATHPELKAELSTALATAYRQLGALDRARHLADTAVAASAGGTVAAAARVERARIALASARLDEAESDLRRVLQQSDAPSVHSEARVRLAEVLVERGQPQAAREMLDAAVAADQGTLSAPVRLRDLAMLGNVQFRAGDMAAAERSLRAALALAQSHYGTRHTETARVAHDLAVTLLQRGDNAQAAEWLQGAEQTRRELLGADHPDLAQTVFNLAVARQRLGDITAAQALYTQALNVQRRALGENHPDVANSQNSLALLAWTQGDVDTAIVRLNEALDTARRAYGERHPTIATMLSTLGGFERNAGRLDAALAHSQESVASARAALGEQHYLLGVALIGMAATQNERGDTAAALVSYAQGLALLDRGLGRPHADTVQSRAGYADALLGSGDPAAARREIDAALADLGDSLAPGHPRRARVQLVALRVHIAQSGCAGQIAPLQATATALGKGGRALLADLASAEMLIAYCLTQQHDAAAASARDAAAATLTRLPYVPRRLRADSATQR